jgi:hypothetical protein
MSILNMSEIILNMRIAAADGNLCRKPELVVILVEMSNN